MAPAARTPASANQLLGRIAARERERIVSACDIVPVAFGHALYESGDAIRHVYFPTSGFVSLLTPDGRNHSLEVGLVGSEGIVGSTLALGIGSSPLRALVQGEGSALRMSVGRFGKALNDGSGLRRVVDAYLYVQLAQIAQTAACGRFHGLDARLARWILLTQDRARGSRFRLTHELLAQMLGVRRAGVTIAAGLLQKKHLIQYRRGVIDVLNRSGLEAAACACYPRLNEIYADHLPAPKKRAS